MSTVTREFVEADRYLYDHLLIPQGFAQVDTDSDASWYGTWGAPWPPRDLQLLRSRHHNNRV